MQNSFKILLFVCLIIGFAACKDDAKKKPTKVNKPVAKMARVKVPTINADSVYSFVKKQVDFGTRVPASIGHTKCKNWLKSKFESYGATVIMQDFVAEIYTGEKLASTNIIAQINPNNPNKILLAAHWDSRMVAEKDKDKKKRNNPIDGADDGASGVGVLLEIARIIQENPIKLGVDILLFDAEDNGTSEQNATSNSTWCLGSQYWSKKTHYNSNNKPIYGVLLDMVGAEDATFYKEGVSAKYAPVLQNKVWSLAHKMNSGKYFINQRIGGITDDHLFVNTIARIPMIDIINIKANGMFGNHHHTHDDNIDIISKETLKKVTQLITAVTYKTSDNSL